MLEVPSPLVATWDLLAQAANLLCCQPAKFCINASSPASRQLCCSSLLLLLQLQAVLSPAAVQEMRSPLVVATLESLAQAAEPGALVRELRQLFPHLVQLICSRQAPIRAALAGLFSQHLPALLPL